MTRRRAWIAAAAGAAAAGAVAIVLLLALGSRGSGRGPAHAVAVRTALDKSGVLFADPLRASIHVLVDRRRIDPSRVGFDTEFKPFTRIGIPHVTRRDAGRLTRLQYTATLLCVTAACLPREETRRVQFAPAKVFFTRGGGARRSLSVEWAPLSVASRTTDLDLANADPFLQPSWHASTEPLAVSWRVDPAVLRGLLFAGGGVLLVLGALGAVVSRRTATARRRRPALSPLERAVLLVEQAAARADTPEQRKALELLARELATSGERDLAVAARELAWAERPPVPAATEPLTVGVRQMIGEGANGDGR